MLTKKTAFRNTEKGLPGGNLYSTGSPVATRRRSWVAALALAAAAGSSLGAVVHVNIASGPGGNGTTWATAFNALDAGLAAAQSGDQLWVATGTYLTPLSADSRSTSSFIVPQGVSLYGGFAGTETELSQAQPSTYPTVLMGSQDPARPGQVVVFRHSNATISGFIVRDGFAADEGTGSEGGGGLLIDGGMVNVLFCTFTNNRTFFFPNQDYGKGGAICITRAASVSIDKCNFDSNYTHGSYLWQFLSQRLPLPGHGGAIYVDSSELTVTNCIFSSNRGGSTTATCEAGMPHRPGAAASGGAIYASDSLLTVSECKFSGNSGGSSHGVYCGDQDPRLPNSAHGGAAGQGGAIYLSGGTAFISRTIFQNNTAGTSDIGSGSGGAIYAAGPVNVANCRFLANSAGNGVDGGDAGDGGGIASTASVFFVNCEFTGNKAGFANISASPPGLDGIGAAIYAADSNLFLNCTIAKNFARGQAAGAYGAELLNSIVYFNDSTLLGQSLDAQMVGGSAIHCNIQSWIRNPFLDPTYLNLDSDPKFANLLGPDGVAGTPDDNTRLTETSPAIDSANSFLHWLHLNNVPPMSQFLNVDLDDAPRTVDDPNVVNLPYEQPLDRGAYEFKPACPGDLNNDGQVDDADFVFFAAAYNILDCSDPTMPTACPSDFNHDHVVDDFDFVIFSSAYNTLICP